MEPKEINLKLKTGENIYAWHLSPHPSPLAVICLCHGWGEHSLRYKHRRQLLRPTASVFAWDHYGHGQSEGSRAHQRVWGFMEEIHLAMEKATMLFPNSPIVLYGHSMGGNIAINFALRNSAP